MHGFEYGGVGADVGAGGHSQAAHQARDQVGEDVAEQVGGHQHVELPRVQHQLHGAGIDDDGVQDETALVLAFVEFLSRLEKDSGQGLHDIGLVHDGHFLAAGRDGVLEREFQQAAAALTRVDARGHGDGVRVVVDLDVVLVPDVQAFEVFAHDHQIDLVEAAARDQSARGAQVGVQLEFFPQSHIGGAVSAAGRGFERALQCQTRAADAVDGLGRQRIAGCLDSLEARGLGVPFERRTERSQDG